jgi:hypothetical protein
MQYQENPIINPNWNNNGTFNSAFGNSAGVNFPNSYIPGGSIGAAINNKIINQVDANSINKRNKQKLDKITEGVNN